MNKSGMNDFEKQIQDVLRSTERELDADTAQHLVQARSRALKSAGKRQTARFFMPVTGMALASVVALVLVLSPNLQDNQTTPWEMMKCYSVKASICMRIWTFTTGWPVKITT